MCAKTMGVARGGALALALFMLGSSQARAQFSENFDSGSATYTANDPYWTDQTQANGYIIKTTNDTTVFHGDFHTSITSDASGSGYFLFTGTAGSTPTGKDEFYISPTFTVTPNTDYNINFSLTNANTINVGSIHPELDGTLLGSPVSATGTFNTAGWQQFTFSWNSGSNTSASLILHDLQTQTTGNDFGVDAISVAAVPEPGNVALLIGMGLTGAGFLARQRVRIRKTA